MLDQILIANTTTHACQAINNSVALNKNFRILDNFLSSEIVIKLQEYINDVDESVWNPVPLQEMLPRRSIDWQADTVIEEIHIIADALTQHVNQLFKTSGPKLQSVQLWRDSAGYSLSPHKDNPIIDISLQVYLFDSPSELGTSFMLDKKVLDLPFRHNTGYVLFKESYDSRIKHWSTTTVPQGVTRYSLYLTWSTYGKQAPDPHDIVHLM